VISAKAGHGQSSISCDTPATALLLRDAHKKAIRVSWDDPKKAGEARPLGAGSYTVVGYRISKKDRSGTEWMLTSSGTDLGKVIVKPGETLDYKFPTKLDLRKGVNVNAGAGRVSASFFYGGGGVTIYRSGKRIPMPYSLLDSKGRAVGSGSMEYG
jgi:hypothetical protein